MPTNTNKARHGDRERPRELESKEFREASARSLVLGFSLSKCMSTIRLKVMAALLAPTIAATIQPSLPAGR